MENDIDYKNNEIYDLNNFLSKLDEREPTKNMMIWMRYYEKNCKKICCHSIDCGSIRCYGCMKYLSGAPPKKRFQCIECEILPPETLNDPRPVFCEDCFDNENILHNHNQWLKVDEKGIHSIVLRIVGFSELKEINKLDFPILNKEEYFNNEDKTCAICTDIFTKDDPPNSYPGCTFYHGSPQNIKNFGVVDTKQFSHLRCLMMWFESIKRNFYCGKLQFCEVCIFEKEKNGWEEYFKDTKNTIKDKITNNETYDEINKYINERLAINIEKEDFKSRDLFDCIQLEMINLHHQEWLRNLIKKLFKQN